MAKLPWPFSRVTSSGNSCRCSIEERVQRTADGVLEQLAEPHAHVHGLETSEILEPVCAAERKQIVILRPGFAVAHGAIEYGPRISITFGTYPNGTIRPEILRGSFVVLGRLDQAIPFDAIDGIKVDLFFALCCKTPGIYHAVLNRLVAMILKRNLLPLLRESADRTGLHRIILANEEAVLRR